MQLLRAADHGRAAPRLERRVVGGGERDAVARPSESTGADRHRRVEAVLTGREHADAVERPEEGTDAELHVGRPEVDRSRAAQLEGAPAVPHDR